MTENTQNGLICDHATVLFDKLCVEIEGKSHVVISLEGSYEGHFSNF